MRQQNFQGNNNFSSPAPDQFTPHSTMTSNTNNTVKPSTGFAKSLSTLVGRIATTSSSSSNPNIHNSPSTSLDPHQQQQRRQSTSNATGGVNVPFYGQQQQQNPNNNNNSRSASSSATFTLASTLARHHPPVVLNANQNSNSNITTNFASPQQENNTNNVFAPNINLDGAPQQVLIESLQNLVTFTCSHCGAKRQKGSHCSHCDQALPTVRRCQTCKAVARGKFCSQCGAPSIVVVAENSHQQNNSNSNSNMFQDFDQGVLEDLAQLNGGGSSNSHQQQVLEGGFGAPANQQWKAVDMAWKTRSGF